MTNKQLVFIDDSGDPGFKLGKGSTNYFVIACVIFTNTLDAEETALYLKKYRQEIMKSETFEFKFSKTDVNIKKKALSIVSKCNFKVRAIYVNKSVISSDFLKNSKENFYNYAIAQVLDKTTYLQNAIIKLDGHADRKYRKSARTYFSHKLNSSSKKFSKLSFVNSQTNILIQLADLVAGSVREFYENKKSDSKEYLNIINKRIEDLWNFK
jgi:hypothetical protein